MRRPPILKGSSFNGHLSLVWRMQHCAAGAHLALNSAFMQYGLMFRRSALARWGRLVLACCGAILIAGCGKSPQPPAATSDQPAPEPVLLAVHWIGKSRLAQDTNAAFQMGLWNLPESVRLEQQTLDKLARALPELLGAAGDSPTNLLSELVRPLLDDLIQLESFSELRARTNQPAECALAIRLPDARRGLWETNLTTLQAAVSAGDSNASPARAHLQFASAGEWCVFGWNYGSGTLFTDFVERFAQPKPTVTPAGSWLELQADLSRLWTSNTVVPAEKLPFLRLTFAGEGQTVRTKGELVFAKPLQLELEPWNVPTNLIHDPLVSFTALRGIRSVLESSPLWQRRQLGAAPNQLYAWALGNIPSQSYVAAAWPNSSNRVRALAERLMPALNSHTATNWLGKVSWLTNANGLVWTENPFAQPFMRHELGVHGELLVGGFSPLISTGQPIPSALLPQFVSQTNVVYYDWEITEARVLGWLYLSQFVRFVSGKAQLISGSPGLQWLQTIGPKLGNAATVIHQAAPERLTFSRVSSAGLTGIELQLLVDWLESPAFPMGLHTFRAPTPVKPGRSPQNSQPDLSPKPIPNEK